MTRRHSIASKARARAGGSRNRRGRLRSRPAMPSYFMYAHPVPFNGVGFGVAPTAKPIKGLILHVQTGYCVDPIRGQVYGGLGEPIGRACADGYVRVHGVVGGPQTLYAHRLVWEVVNGPIPPGFHIDHKNAQRSDNRARNLQAVTPSRNAALCFERGGRLPGEAMAHSKLTDALVRRIRTELDVPTRVFARQLNLDPATVRAVRAYRTWRHVSDRSKRSRRPRRKD